ncbi:hypothetical protein GCM10010293_41230 [Streptomyces griseoflavus]|uniref:hypothetical protein n=1 Tax=Streptomyces griseoflavus TaxID=35619 RepID=UPI00167C5414|nr:hypothetical protein [Streptomyces griseoflavus]GGV37419.1 hypothetical protein GCM10010293_41230 [Streptomyces griseoflavus]
MAYRPYPNVDRALNQVGRHYQVQPVVELECLRPMSESFTRLRESARKVLADQPGRYVLSTRRDSGQIRVTGGESSSGIAIDSIRPWTRSEVEGWYRGEGSPRPGTVSGSS